jgi:hypothetical protein
MATLRFEIKGELGSLTLRAVEAALELNLRMLGEYDRGISQERRGSLEWVLTKVTSGSLLLDVQSRSRTPGRDFGPAVARQYVDGWNLIEHEGATPPYLTLPTMLKARQVTRLIGTEGVYGYAASDMDETAEVTARASAHMEQLVTVRYHALGAVEGTIETVSIHGGKRFVLYHSRTKKAVTCTFEDDEWLRQAADMLGRRVSVMGTVYFNARGEPVRVEARSLRLFRRPEELPTTQSLTRSDPNFTGGLSTEDFIQEIRGA